MNNHSYALFDSTLNKTTIANVLSKGFRVFEIPLYAIEKNDLNLEEFDSIRSALAYDWIIFTDVLIVDLFIEYLSAIDFDIYDLDAVRVCAFGEAVADQLRFSEIHSDIIANSIDAESVLKQITQFVGNENFCHLKILELNRHGNPNHLGDLLRLSGANVIEASLYQLNEPTGQAFGKIRALIRGGAVDEFLLSDPKDLIFLEKLFTDIGFELASAKLTATNRTLLQMLAERGLTTRMFSTESTPGK